MTTIRACLDEAIASLEGGRIAGARLDAQLLMAHALGHNRAWLLAHDDDQLTGPTLSHFQSLIAQRADHIPVVHLTGTRQFYGLDLHITPDVLTPRVETEQIVEWAVGRSAPRSRVADIGTGSGAIALALKHARPDLRIVATEISPQALEVARLNAKDLDLDIELVISDLWENVTGVFDCVVTNLPYLRDDAELMPEVKREPAVALFGGDDGLELYRRFLKGLPAHLRIGGHLFTECDPWQHESLMAVAREAGLVPIEQGYFILGFERRS
jgi:release factor glutamine methyltransferase